jgi:hypothetical protein
VREAFDELRKAEAGLVPPFERVWAAAQARARPGGRLRVAARLAWGALLAAAAAVALLVTRGGNGPPALALAAWRSPTEFLLRTPGDTMLRSVPLLSASVVEVQPWWRGRATP